MNPTGRIYTSQQICRGAQGTYIYVTMIISGSRVKIIPPFRASHKKKKHFQIIKRSRRPGITQKYCFQRSRSRNKSIFHDVYIRPKGTEFSFPWRIYTSSGSSDWIVVGAYYGRIIITPGLKGLISFTQNLLTLKDVLLNTFL